MSAPATRTDAQALRELLRGMSLDAQRAFLARGFGPAILARVAQVEQIPLQADQPDALGHWLVGVLDHAGLDASMLELFHGTGGVPWGRCLAVARATHIPLTDVPPEPGAPAEHARGAVVLTVDGPPNRQRWSTRALLAALQGLHRRLEARPALRSPRARPLLSGVSADERHLVLRADPPTIAALLALTPDELATVTGLPVRAIAGERTAVHSHRPVILALVGCALLLLASLVGKQWQLSQLAAALHTRGAEDSEVRLPTAVIPEAASTAAPVPEAADGGEPAAEGDAVPVADAPTAPVPLADTEPAEAAPDAMLPPAWVPSLHAAMKGTGATVDVAGAEVSVAFSDDLLAFAPGESELSARSQASIRQVGQFLRRHPDLYVWVEGHTDDAAFSSGNWLLGAQRALAVVESLTQSGVPASRVILTSHGEHRPVAPNSTADGRRRNRRVELVLSASAQR